MGRSSRISAFLSVLALAATSARAQTNQNEVEPNSNKAEATVVACLAAGDTLTGTTTGNVATAGSTLSTSTDYWRVSTCALAPSIYRHQLLLTTSGTAAHTTQIRGLNQTGTAGVGGTAGTTDVLAQPSLVSTGSVRLAQWYGFGQGESVYYRVAGTAATTAPYVATLATSVVTPTALGNFQAGSITITLVGQGHNTDSELWVYDASLNAIPAYGNDDPPGLNVSPSTLTRTYSPGTYYLAVCDWNLASDQVATNDDGFVTGNLLDFPDAILNNSPTIPLNLAFAVTDSSGTTQFPATKTAAYEIVWFKFTVGGGGGIVAMCPGDSSSPTACPCGNTGAPGRGCENSASTGGAVLAGTGTTSPDTLVLTSSGELPTALSIFLQGNQLASPPLVFGDGVRCAAGTLKRLYVKNASGGVVSAPAGADPSVTTQSANLGDPIAPGSMRWYQVYYRDPNLAFCPAPAGNAFNVSTGLAVTW